MNADGEAEKEKQAVVYVDHRELKSGVPGLLADYDFIKLREKALPVADYIVSERVAIERKTGSDFVSSIIDGRVFTQAEELVGNYTNPLIIIEGDVFGVRNINKNAVQGALFSLMIDRGIPVLMSESASRTAEIIALLAKREQLGKSHVTRLRGEKKKFTGSMGQQFIVESLPGVGPELAKNLLNHFGSVGAVFDATEKQLCEVDKIGEKKAKEIFELINLKWKNKI
ncbi:MAG: ERCC4 domain-containing protein [Candidatus Micrarchaeota archaeon]